MARGKGGLSSNVVLVTTRRRAASVPAEPITLSNYSYTPATYRRAQRISHDLTDDSDTIRSASKRQDQRLLDNVNNTMASAGFNQPVTVKRSRSRPPPAPKKAPAGGCARRVAAVRRRQEEDEEFDCPDFRLPSRRVRSASVPPPTTTTRRVIDTGFIDTKSPLMKVVDDFRVRPSYVSDTPRFVRTFEVSPPKPRRPYIPETPSYVASSTYSSRSASEPPKMGNYVADQAVRRAREALGRVEREYGSYGSSPYDADIYDYDDEPPIRHTTITPVRSTASTGFLRSSAPVVTRRTHSRPPTVPRASASPTRAHRLAEIEARIDRQTMSQAEPVVSYNTLRTRASNARDKMDVHKVMMDRYLPIHMGPVNEVQHEVLQKYGELEQRMPSLQPYRPSRDVVTRSSSVPPYRPPPSQVAGGDRRKMYGEAMRVQPFTPSMSDTRKRCREVLCKTKRDPHYFDY